MNPHIEYVDKNTNYPCVRVRKVVRVANPAYLASLDLKAELDYQRDKMVKEAARDAVHILGTDKYSKYTAAVVDLEVIKDVDSRHNVVSELIIVEVGGQRK